MNMHLDPNRPLSFQAVEALDGLALGERPNSTPRRIPSDHELLSLLHGLCVGVDRRAVIDSALGSPEFRRRLVELYQSTGSRFWSGKQGAFLRNGPRATHGRGDHWPQRVPSREIGAGLRLRTAWLSRAWGGGSSRGRSNDPARLALERAPLAIHTDRSWGQATRIGGKASGPLPKRGMVKERSAQPPRGGF